MLGRDMVLHVPSPSRRYRPFLNQILLQADILDRILSIELCTCFSLSALVWICCESQSTSST